MKYLIEVEKKAQKQIDKLRDKILRKDIETKIRALAYNPRKGKHLFQNFYELKSKNYRIYYAIFRGIIVIETIEYEGKVRVIDIGTKDSQKRDLGELKWKQIKI